MRKNQYLEERETSKERYRRFVFLVDCPEVKADPHRQADPPHAIAGDELYEGPNDDLTPFELWREGNCIGTPERWAVSHLLEGLTEDHAPSGRYDWPTLEEINLVSGDEAYVVRTPGPWDGLDKIEDGALFCFRPTRDPRSGQWKQWQVYAPWKEGEDKWTEKLESLTWSEFETVRSLVEVGGDPELRAAVERIPVDDFNDLPHAVYVREGVPAADLRAGDVLLTIRYSDEAFPDASTEPLVLDRMRAAYEAAESGAIVDLTPWRGWTKPGSGPWTTLTDRRRWGLQAKTFNPKLQVVRFPIRRAPERVSTPIEAFSDEAAIFELIASSGGRMPA